MKEYYKARIDEANSLDELDYIVERASNELESNADYSEVYSYALAKAQSWSPLQ